MFRSLLVHRYLPESNEIGTWQAVFGAYYDRWKLVELRVYDFEMDYVGLVPIWSQPVNDIKSLEDLALLEFGRPHP